MIKLILSLVFSGIISAQTTGQLCYAPDKTVPAKTVCMDITPVVTASLAAFEATQKVQTGVDGSQKPIMAAKYQGHGDLIFSYLTDGLFAPLLDQFPTAAIQTAKVAIAKGNSDMATAKAAAMVKVSAPDPTATGMVVK